MEDNTNANHRPGLHLPEGAEILIGPRGSKYYLHKGKKVYLNKRRRIRQDTKYTVPRGAFARYLSNQKIFDS